MRANEYFNQSLRGGLARRASSDEHYKIKRTITVTSVVRQTPFRHADFTLAFKKQLSAMGIRDGPTVPRSPWQNGFAEHLIGSIRRERLDHLIILNASHLHRVLKAYENYYNNARTHFFWA